MKHLFILVLFILLSTFITYPLIFNLGSLVTGKGDELVLAWIHNWVIHSLLNGNFLNIFNANTYYPATQSLAFSDAFFTSSLLALIPVKLINQPIVAVNFTLITSIALLGFSVYILVWYLIKETLASLLSGMLVIFSPAVLDKTVHLQILSIFYVSFALLFFIHFLKTKKSFYLFFSLLFFLLQTYNSFLPGYFILFSMIVISFFSWIDNRKKIKELINKKNIFMIILFSLMILPIALPYFNISDEYNYKRDIRDSIHFALQPEDFLFTNSFSKMNGLLISLPINKVSQNNEFKPGYLGFIFSILGIVSLIYVIKNIKKQDIYVKSFLTIAIIGLVLSFGPLLHLGRHTIHAPFPVPLPYGLLYYLLPGFAGFRNSARWEMLFILALSVLVGYMLHKLIKAKGTKRVVIYFFLIFGVIIEYNYPMKFYSITSKDNFPQEYFWLTQTPENSKIIEFPIFNWNDQPYVNNEIMRQYFGTTHFRKTVNGYSGFSPPPWQRLVNNYLSNFPSNETIDGINKLGINYIIVHVNEYNQLNKDKYTMNNKHIENGNQIIKGIEKYKELKFIIRFEDTYVYEVDR
jgi:hypothetical protein